MKENSIEERAAAPLPSARPLAGACYQRDARRGGVGGGVCIFLPMSLLVTPPLPLPYMGGERHAACLLAILEFFKWVQKK